MRPVQPPITTEEEYHGYQRGRDTLTKVVQEREQRLVEALARGDETLIEARRFELLHVLADRQAIIDAIKQYEQHVSQSA
jgi:tetraacyldisaccharide-1-P 4'-kinase